MGYLCSINQQVFLNIGLFSYYCMKVKNKNKTFLSVVKLMEYKRIGTINFKDSINTRVFVQFLAQDVSVGTQKDRISRFISLRMVDKDISVEAKMFGVDNNTIELVKDGKVYNAAVDVKPYDKSQFGYSCIIYNIDTSDDSPESFLDWADNLGECQKIIENILPIIINTYYGQLAYRILVENWDKFVRWTAARSQHHTRLGELLVHTAEVVSIAEDLADRFNGIYGDGFINKPLLLSAAIIHDIGKVLELEVSMESGRTAYSKHSVLCTHIMDAISAVDIQAYKLGLGVQRLKVNEIGEDEEVKTPEQLHEEREAVELLKHCLAAHHGKLEYGSPIVPNTPEAYLLNVADELSSTVYKFNSDMRSIEPGEFSCIWTPSGYKATYKDSSKGLGSIK